MKWNFSAIVGAAEEHLGAIYNYGVPFGHSLVKLTPDSRLFSILINTGIHGVTPINEIYNGSIIWFDLKGFGEN